MVGYASSCDDKHSCDEIAITVFLSEHFSCENEADRFEVYSVKRDFSKVRKLKGPDDGFSLPYQSFVRIARMLHSEEIKNTCACRVSWRSTDGIYIEKIKTEFLEDVYFPSPVYIDHCQDRCIDVTNAFFKDTPKPFGASMVCDALNFLIACTNLNIPHSFFNCMNSVYCSENVLGIVACIFPDCDIFSRVGLNDININSRSIDIQKEIITPLESFVNLPSSHAVGSLGLATDAKRECISGVCKDLCRFIGTQGGLEKFLSSFSNHTEIFSDKLTNLSEVFVETENINSVSDVYYLTLYELFSAFAFYDIRLSLKTTVARNRLRQRILNKIKLPYIIYKERIFDYEN